MEKKTIFESQEGLEEQLNTLCEKIDSVIESNSDQEVESLIVMRRWLEVVRVFFQQGDANYIIPSEISVWLRNISKVTKLLEQWIQTPGSPARASHRLTLRSQFENQITSFLRSVSIMIAAQGLSAQCIREAGQQLAIGQYDEVLNIAKNANESLSEINKMHSQTQAHLDAVAKDREAIENIRARIIDGTDDEPSTQSAIEKMYRESAVKAKQVSDAHAEVCLGLKGEQSIFNSLKEHKIEAEDILEKAEQNLVAQETMLKELRSFHVKVYGREEDDNIIGGLDSDINQYKEKLKKFEEEQNVKYNSLNEEIENLLPGASSAGLASAYKELKEECDSPIKNYSRIFYCSIAFLFVCSFIFVVDKFDWNPFSISFVHAKEWTEIATNGLKRLPFVLPALWLAVFASKRRSEYQRLRHEYSHKESLAKSYNSYKKQIDELGEEHKQLLETLLEKTIHAIAFNASTTLDKKHSDGTIAENVANRLLKGKS